VDQQANTDMSFDFSSVHNHHEQSVFEAVARRAPQHPGLAGDPQLLADVACVALSRLPARYIRHEVDFSFYLTERERTDNETAIDDAVTTAFGFVQARVAMRARR
jgi:hypothetical protein